MRESKFIEQNKAKWHSFQNNLDKKGDSDKVRENFIQITDDLSYARTFYKNRSVRVYLNGLALKLYSKVYKKKNFTFKKFKAFWTTDLPQIMYVSRKQVYLAFVVFFMFMAVGWFSQAQHPEFATEFFGEQYIQETEKNIKEGNPLGIYGSDGQFSTFFRITINNLRVAFICFILGLFFGLGTTGFMIVNGVMLGTFWRYFYDRGLSSDFNFTVWMHGGFEILAIILSGAASYALAQGIIYPGTFNRLRSVQLSAKRGVSIMLGITPFIVVAGFIEGYFTRFTNVPNIIRGTFIVSSILFFLYYFLLYPYLKFKKTKATDLTENDMPPLPTLSYSEKNILSSSEQFYYSMINTLGFFAKRIGVVVLSITVVMGASFLLFNTFKLSPPNIIDNIEDIFLSMIFRNLSDFNIFIKGNGHLFNSFIVGSFSTLLFVLSFLFVNRKFSREKQSSIKLSLVSFPMFMAVAIIPYLTGGQYFFLYYLVLFIVITLLNTIFFTEGGNVKNGISTGFTFIFSNFLQWVGSAIMVVFVAFLIRIVFTIPFNFLVIRWLDMLFISTDANYTQYMHAMTYLINVFSYVFVFIFMVYKKFWFIVSTKEILTGQFLNQEIENMSLKKDIYGFKTE